MTELPKLIPISNPHACGLGMGQTCCAYLSLDKKGVFSCVRPLPATKAKIDKQITEGTLFARRQPTKRFPECQLGD